MADPEIGPPEDKVWWSELLATEMDHNGDPTKGIECSERLNSPYETGDCTSAKPLWMILTYRDRFNSVSNNMPNTEFTGTGRRPME